MQTRNILIYRDLQEKGPQAIKWCHSAINDKCCSILSVSITFMCFFVEKNEEWATYIFGKSVQWKIAFKLTTKSMQTLQICCKTVNINVA